MTGAEVCAAGAPWMADEFIDPRVRSGTLVLIISTRELHDCLALERAREHS